MNANTLIDDSMTLDEKLAAIDLALLNAQRVVNDDANSRGMVAAPIDPADLTTCDSCQ